MKRWLALLVVGLVLAGLAGTASRGAQGGKKVENRFFEMRTYYAAPGKMEALHTRFREHTNKLFVKHGMTLIGYWTPADSKGAQERLIYILAYPSKEAREASWKAFVSDPDWLAAKAKSEQGGKLVDRVEPVYMNPTDYSPIK